MTHVNRAAAAKSLQSCPTLCDPIDGSPTGSPTLGFSRQEHWSGVPLQYLFYRRTQLKIKDLNVSNLKNIESIDVRYVRSHIL